MTNDADNKPKRRRFVSRLCHEEREAALRLVRQLHLRGQTDTEILHSLNAYLPAKFGRPLTIGMTAVRRLIDWAVDRNCEVYRRPVDQAAAEQLQTLREVVRRAFRLADAAEQGALSADHKPSEAAAYHQAAAAHHATVGRTTQQITRLLGLDKPEKIELRLENKRAFVEGFLAVLIEHRDQLPGDVLETIALQMRAMGDGPTPPRAMIGAELIEPEEDGCPPEKKPRSNRI